MRLGAAAPAWVALWLWPLLGQSPAIDFFESRVRPLLAAQCYACHSGSAKIAQGGLRLDHREFLLKGGHSGAAVTPGKPAESRLIQAVRHEAKPAMPPTGKLKPEQIGILEKWAEMGFPWPDEPVPEAGPKNSAKREDPLRHWAWQPVRNPAPPQMAGQSATPIDRFVLSALERRRLTPNGSADAATLLRRVYLDLTGLPPGVEEMRAFLADPSRAAFEKAVDRLLAAPEFGERWGRHWLDVTYYGDTMDLAAGIPAAHAWRYRDYVIAAYNSDKPYNRFLLEQLAGDKLPYKDGFEHRENVVATGYLALGPWALVQSDKEQLRMDVVDLQIDAIGKGVLGLTLSCARCHDHKFDPVSQREYFGLAGILASTRTIHGRQREDGVFSDVNQVTLYESPEEAAVRIGKSKPFEAELERLRSRREQLQAALDRLPKEDEAKRGELSAQILDLRRREIMAEFNRPKPPVAYAVTDVDEPADCRINIRGNAHQLGEPAPRTFVKVAMPGARAPALTGSGRLEMAQWIASERNPLTARVYVNRVWQHLFGAGLVRTADNFGLRGETPSHPELLDYLAYNFMHRGWSTKALLREIVLSDTYRRSSAANPQAAEADPENRLLWKMNRKRLEAETIRDAVLAVTGALDRTRGGYTLPTGSLTTFAPDTGKVNPNRMVSKGALPDHLRNRRTVYLPIYRGLQLPDLDILNLFDFANNAQVNATRQPAVVPTQTLYLMNSPWLREQCRLLAKRALNGTVTLDHDRAKWLIETVYARPASDEEARKAVAFIYDMERVSRGAADPAEEAWTRFVQTLAVSNEFLFRS